MGYSGGSLASFGDETALRHAMRRTVDAAGDELLDRTKRHTPVAKPPAGAAAEWLEARHRAPGTLRESWERTAPLEEGDVMSVDVLTHDKIAPFVEWPTLPHVIVPRKTGGRLRWWDSLGSAVYATIVFHTGTKGSYMLTTAVGEMKAEWRRIGEREMQDWARAQAAQVG